MAKLKEQLRNDLKDAMKARDDVRRGTIRMALTAISKEETAGEAHELSDDEVLAVLSAEAKRRRESADLYVQNGRDDLAAVERDELAVLETYLPSQLDDAELERVVDEAITEAGADSPKQMGQVVKTVLAKVGNRADGKRVAALAKAKLTS